MTSDYLKLSYTHSRDPMDSLGRLMVEVQAAGFAGMGGMWVQWQDLLELSERLAAFPIPANDPPTEDWGYGEVNDYRSIIRLEFVPDSSGRAPVVVKVGIADEDDGEIAVRCKFKIGYPAIEMFRIDLKEMAQGKSNCCILKEQD